MTKNPYLRFVEWTSVLLFFIQALRVIFSVLFGIIYDGVFEGPFTAWLAISVLILLLAFLCPLFISNLLQPGHLSWLAILTALTRVMISINLAEVRYWGALLTLLFGGLYIASALRFFRYFAATSTVFALGIDQFLRVLGHTYDIGLRGWWIPVQIIWVIFLFIGSVQLRKSNREEKTDIGLSLVSGLALGSFLFLQTSLLLLPNAIARWSDTKYELITPILLLLTLSFLIPNISSRVSRTLASMWILRLCSGILLILGLMVGYFMTGLFASVGLLVAHITSLVLIFYVLEITNVVGRRTGASISFAFFILLIFNFLNAFTFTYPYTLLVLREMGWVVYLIAAFFTVLSALRRISPSSTRIVVLPIRALLPMGLMIVLTIAFIWPSRIEDISEGGILRIATYNIHYGYDDDWHFTLEALAETIEENDCDAVTMQEVDTGRMTSYGVDDAYYLAHRLGMNVAYLPTVENLTGIGILYRGQKGEVETALLTSLQEQTGIIGVTLDGVNKPLYVYGTWLGLSNEDTLRQISEALDFIGDRSPAAFGADFNAHYEDPEMEAVRKVGFVDPFTELGIDPIPNTSPAIQPDHRIDFVWIKDLEPVKAWVSESLASDHRMVVVEVDISP